MAVSDPRDLLPLQPAAFHILLALADGEKHGYGIMQETERATGGDFKLWPGTLYTTIKRLLELELISESDERPDPEMDDQRRRYYRLTDLGRRTALLEAERLRKLVTLADERRLAGGRSQ
jgi:DNA-binding PadR family transcriptional regulator